MSLKSFDKFCEKIIMGEPDPINRKEIFDERQNQVRQKLIIEALTVFGAAVSLNTLVMDCGAKWCEGYFAPIALLVALCYMYWLIRVVKKDALFGIEGTAKAERTAWSLVTMPVLYSVIMIRNEDKELYIARDGMVSETFVLIMFFVIAIVCGTVTLVLAHKEKKRVKAEEAQENPPENQ
ncbi:MAG: hypothetical protein K2G32_02640 [Oscillospiraceae bacterium]|nr:hypothetical protein [Oscillospiraceae bacterium]